MARRRLKVTAEALHATSAGMDLPLLGLFDPMALTGVNLARQRDTTVECRTSLMETK